MKLYLHKILVILLFLASPFSVHAYQECIFENLKEYSLTFFRNKTKKDEAKIHRMTIYLPLITKINAKFCGYWESKELTNHSKVQFEGFVYDASRLKLYLNPYPDMADNGYGLTLTNNFDWIQSGELMFMGIAGVVIGTYQISSK